MAHYNEETFQKYKEYLAIPEEERPSKASFCRENDVSPPTLDRWEAEIVKGDNHNEDDADKLIRQIRDMDESVFNAATIKHIAKMAELWYKRHGLLIDKSEQLHRVALTADDIFRIRNEVRREFEEAGIMGEGTGE